MSNAADKKRWAILPPPSSTSSKISGEFPLQQPEIGRQQPARRTVSGQLRQQSAVETERPPVDSGVQELEPSDSERVTEVPPTLGSEDEASPFGHPGLETIPAPPLDESDEPHEG